MTPALSTKALLPFGIEATAPEGTRFEDLDPDALHAMVAEHRVLVLRGVVSMKKEALPVVARRLGPLCAFSFGAVNELKPDPKAKNYLYTNRAVPLHWDGAFIGEIPRYLFFHCVDAPDENTGGETVFVDTTRVWSAADEETRALWRQLRCAYETDSVAHYGGRFEARVVGQHPHTHEMVLRFAEPVEDLNPVSVTPLGLSPIEAARVIAELQRALANPDAVLAHVWKSGDLVLADNHALLHGRRAMSGGEKRHIRRVNIASESPRTLKSALLASLRIRRPEFMVAEVPILAIPALLLGTVKELGAAAFVELTALFFLLFHFGDMINCYADRELDAVYKTKLSEAVFTLGVRNVRRQLHVTTAAAFVLAVHLAFTLRRPLVIALVACGLALGAQYSVGPLRLKGRGAWQVLALWAVIFAGPMGLVIAATTERPWGEWPLLALVASYGAMQQGTILVNTAEDLPEDTESGVRTTAVALGLSGCVALARAMVTLGGAGCVALLGYMAQRAGQNLVIALGPLVCAWLWVAWELSELAGEVRGVSVDEGVKKLRPYGRRMPLWITATAWASLWAAALVRTEWLR